MLDRDHMKQRLDLWLLADVWQMREGILDQIRGDRMPPGAVGGPWPEEFVTLFERWLQTGTNEMPGHHLEDVTAQSYELKKVFGQRLRLEATVMVPTAGYHVWFELENMTDSSRQYRLIAEPPYPAQAAVPTSMLVSEKMPAVGLTQLIVFDAVGKHELIVQ
jgi:hypothetical protein